MTIGGKLDAFISKNNNVIGAITSGATFAKMAMDGNIKDAFNTVYKHSDGGLNVANLAGTAFGVSAAARIASGGGLYKNARGETDLIGVPFI